MNYYRVRISRWSSRDGRQMLEYLIPAATAADALLMAQTTALARHTNRGDDPHKSESIEAIDGEEFDAFLEHWPFHTIYQGANIHERDPQEPAR